MEFAGCNLDDVALHTIDKPVFLGNFSRPKSFPVFLKGFGFSDTGVRCLVDGFNQLTNFFEDHGTNALPFL